MKPFWQITHKVLFVFSILANEVQIFLLDWILNSITSGSRKGLHLDKINIKLIEAGREKRKKGWYWLASHTGVFRGVRISFVFPPPPLRGVGGGGGRRNTSSPKNACVGGWVVAHLRLFTT